MLVTCITNSPLLFKERVRERFFTLSAFGISPFLRERKLSFSSFFKPYFCLLNIKRALLTLCLLALSFQAFSQKRSIDTTMRTVVIDSILVVTARAGLNADDFIQEILKDTAFYQAFRDMKKYSFIAENQIYTYDKRNRPDAKIYRRIFHDNSGEQYKPIVLASKDSGNVYDRKGDYELFTVKMFSYIFMNQNSTEFTDHEVSKKENQEESYKEKLKTLIFTPGKPVKGIPLISNKTMIFDPEMRKYYDYTFHHATYLDSIPVYRFKCTMKPGLSPGKQDDIMIKELTTIFDKRNFQILGRFIDLTYYSPLFDFDVKMNIELSYFGKQLLPVRISYNGFWDIPFKDMERCSFRIKHFNYKRS